MRKPPPNKINWTNEMEQFIRDNHRVMSDKKIGEVLYVSEHTVKKKGIAWELIVVKKEKYRKTLLIMELKWLKVVCHIQQL